MKQVHTSSYSLGYCMYCGTSKGKLTKEHIVPYSLGGDLTAEKASCDQCQKIINRYETDCTKIKLGPARALLGYRSRKKTTAAAVLKMPLGRQTDTNMLHSGELTVPKAEYPLVVALPTLGLPGLLSGKSNEWRGQCWRYTDQKIPKEFVKIERDDTGPTRILGQMNPLSWFRMLAKIAHGVVCVSHERDSFEPLLTDLILAKSEVYGPFIGMIPEITQYGPYPSYGVETFYAPSLECTYVGVRVQLLGELTSPQYAVIVGKMAS